MNKPDVERRETEKAARQAHQAAVERLRRHWAREGHQPRAHLRQVTHDGDPEVLRSMFDRERAGAEYRRITCRLACLDMTDIASAIRTTRARMAAAG